MFGKKTSSASRRSVLKRAATVGALAVGSAGATSSNVAASQSVEEVDVDLDLSKGTLTELDRHGVVPGTNGVPVSEAVRTGDRLLETLREDGLLETRSLDKVAARADVTYGVRDKGTFQIGFKIRTDEGRLQITFTETGPAFAAFYPEAAPEVRIYSISDDGTYEQTVQELDEGVTTNCEWWCGGCTCESSHCLFSFKKTVCQNCISSGCTTTDSCGC